MNAFDWTPVLTAVITCVSLVAGYFIRYAWRYYLGPWLQEKGLEKAAEHVVYAVEALLGRHCGEEKWLAALEKMTLRGYDVDAEEVVDALKAAWKQLDLAQIMAGEKTITKQEETSEETE